MWCLLSFVFAAEPALTVPVPQTAVVRDTHAPTLIRDPAAGALLAGDHALTLQWVSWEVPGSVVVTVGADGVWTLRGEQRNGADFVTIEGTITEIESKSFVLDGTITTQVSYIAGGKPCTRTGAHRFSMTGKRRYWRMQSMQNPCDGVTDYVDIYLRP